MTRRTEREYLGLIAAATSFAKRHPQYEDIRQTACLEVWRRLATLDRPEAAHRLVVVIARQSVWHFLRSPENEERRYWRSGRERLGDVGLPAEDGPTLYPLVEPDFAPLVIERLWRLWLWKEAWAAADAVDRAVLTAYVREGKSHEQIGREMQRPANFSWRRLRALERRLARKPCG